MVDVKSRLLTLAWRCSGVWSRSQNSIIPNPPPTSRAPIRAVVTGPLRVLPINVPWQCYACEAVRYRTYTYTQYSSRHLMLSSLFHIPTLPWQRESFSRAGTRLFRPVRSKVQVLSIALPQHDGYDQELRLYRSLKVTTALPLKEIRFLNARDTTIVTSCQLYS